MNQINVGAVTEVTLTGQVFAFKNGQPVLLDLPQLGPSLALFQTVEDLRSYMQQIGVEDYTIKRIDNGTEFLKSEIPIPIVCDMHYDTTTGKSKWKLVMPLNQS